MKNCKFQFDFISRNEQDPTNSNIGTRDESSFRLDSNLFKENI